MQIGSVFTKVFETCDCFGTCLNFIEKDECFSVGDFLSRITLKLRYDSINVEVVVKDGLEGGVAFEIEIDDIFEMLLPEFFDSVGFSALADSGYYQGFSAGTVLPGDEILDYVAFHVIKLHYSYEKCNMFCVFRGNNDKILHFPTFGLRDVLAPQKKRSFFRSRMRRNNLFHEKDVFLEKSYCKKNPQEGALL